MRAFHEGAFLCYHKSMMVKFFRVMVLALGVLALTAQMAAAQQYVPPSKNISSDPNRNFPSLQSVFDKLPPEMQDELAKEADKVFAECARNELFAVYQDCECMAVKFLDARLAAGPDLQMIDLMHDVGKECPNTPAIAGKVFDECNLLQQVYALSDTAREKFCTCYANEVANTYTRRPINSYRYHISLRKRGLMLCGWTDVMKESARIRREIRESEYVE